MALKHIKSKIKATERTGKVTKAMEAVSAVKMRKSQERAIKGRGYAEAALRVLSRVAASRDAQNHPLMRQNESGKTCIIVVTSDKGLAGSLNSAVLKEAFALASQETKENVTIICFGRKSYEFFMRRGYMVAQHYLNVRDDVDVNDMEHVVSRITEAYTLGEYARVVVVYQSFISTFEQKASTRAVLPIDTESVARIVADITPTHGRFSENHNTGTVPAYTIEPESKSVFAELFPMLLRIMLYHALLESKASEHSARMVAMKNATDKAKEVMKLLTLKYNKERQSVITREVSEITGGIEAMKVTN